MFWNKRRLDEDRTKTLDMVLEMLKVMSVSTEKLKVRADGHEQSLKNLRNWMNKKIGMVNPENDEEKVDEDPDHGVDGLNALRILSKDGGSNKIGRSSIE